MKRGQYMKEDKLVERAITVLMKELGPVETSRFLAMPAKRRMESVKRHRLWQSALDKNEFFNLVFGKP